MVILLKYLSNQGSQIRWEKQIKTHYDVKSKDPWNRGASVRTVLFLLLIACNKLLPEYWSGMEVCLCAVTNVHLAPAPPHTFIAALDIEMNPPFVCSLTHKKNFLCIHLWALKEWLWCRKHEFLCRWCTLQLLSDGPGYVCWGTLLLLYLCFPHTPCRTTWVKLQISRSDGFEIINIFLGRKVWQQCSVEHMLACSHFSALLSATNVFYHCQNAK